MMLDFHPVTKTGSFLRTAWVNTNVCIKAIRNGDAVGARDSAEYAASWVFQAYPELREVAA